MRGVIILAACATLTACATPYGGMGPMGGVKARRLDDTTILVSGRGNGFTSQERLQTYLLRKAAEETIAAGYDLFLITGGRDTTRQAMINTPGQSYSSTSGNAQLVGNQVFGSAQTTTTYVPGQSFAVVRPGGNLMIKLYRGQKPANAPNGLFDAREVLRYLTTSQ